MAKLDIRICNSTKQYYFSEFNMIFLKLAKYEISLYFMDLLNHMGTADQMCALFITWSWAHYSVLFRFLPYHWQSSTICSVSFLFLRILMLEAVGWSTLNRKNIWITIIIIFDSLKRLINYLIEMGVIPQGWSNLLWSLSLRALWSRFFSDKLLYTGKYFY